MSSLDGLFDLGADEERPDDAGPPALMTASQRSAIRSLFGEMGVLDASGQLDVVAELTGTRFTSVRDVDASTAQRLIQMLPGRIARAKTANTGNSWADRDEDTWIDRL